MQIPQSMGLSAAPSGPLDLTASPDLMKNINKSTLASQMAYQKYNQALQNDPYYVQQEIQREAQKNRESLVRDLAMQGYTQNQMGFQEALGAYDRPGMYDLTREERNRRSQERQFGQTTAAQMATEPFRETAMQREIRKKQTPSYAQLAGGGGGGAVNAISPSFQTTVLNNLMKRYPGMFRRQATDASGKPAVNLSTFEPIYEPTTAAIQVAEQIADRYATTKKPNYMKIEMQTVNEYRKQQGNEMSQMPPKPTALQNLPKPQPTQALKPTQAPTAMENLPKAEPTAAPRTQPTVTALQMIQAIANAKADGKSDEFIRNMIKSRGFEPKNFGY